MRTFKLHRDSGAMFYRGENDLSVCATITGDIFGFDPKFTQDIILSADIEPFEGSKEFIFTSIPEENYVRFYLRKIEHWVMPGFSLLIKEWANNRFPFTLYVKVERAS